MSRHADGVISGYCFFLSFFPSYDYSETIISVFLFSVPPFDSPSLDSHTPLTFHPSFNTVSGAAQSARNSRHKRPFHIQLKMYLNEERLTVCLKYNSITTLSYKA